jgi:hypothetical protein
MSSWPDVEGALRTHLRANTALVTALGGARVFWEIPSDPPWPLVTISRVGGGQDPGEAPVDRALVSFDCWGDLDDKGRARWRELTAVVNALRSALDAIEGRTTLASGVDVFGVSVAGVVRSADPNNGRPRYTVTAEVTAISS